MSVPLGDVGRHFRQFHGGVHGRVRYELAHRALQRDAPDDALRFVRPLLRAGNPRAFQLAGISLALLGRPAEAVDEFRQAADLEPESFINWSNLGHALLEVARPDDVELLAESHRCFDRVLGLRPTKAIRTEAEKQIREIRHRVARRSRREPGDAGAQAGFDEE